MNVCQKYKVVESGINVKKAEKVKAELFVKITTFHEEATLPLDYRSGLAWSRFLDKKAFF